MPMAFYKPSDLDPPILNGRAMGFSPEEIADALGVPLPIVVERLAVNPVGGPVVLPMVPKEKPRNIWRHEKRPQHADADPRMAAWNRAREGAKATRRDNS